MYWRGELSAAGTNDDVSKTADHIAEIGEAIYKVRFNAEAPNEIGPAAEWGARAVHITLPVLRAGWRRLNDAVIRIGRIGGLW